LFFGWEAVGLVSYLLIGFWFKKESANYASLKAFIANRVGDLGFLLGLAGVLTYFGTLDYAQVFSMMPNFAGANQPSIHLIGHIYWQATTVICILLFIGAIGKSAQIPLHIWLEGSMEGPTPISALIHAATMVTAGVFMVARLSPMFEFSPAALSTVLIIGALTCFFMGLLGIVQNDIKRIIAYSTLSQLGYMMAAQGASAFSFGMFHLMTHAAFKALLFLAAGSVILGMHHEQDIRKMGGLAKKMPITYICMLIGALTLAAIPPFAGFYSKDLIIDAVSESTIPGHTFASWLLIGGAFVTALYTFRLFFVVFHGKSRIEGDHHPHESPWTVLVPLILLAIPSVLAGMLFFMPSLNNFFGSSIFVLPQYNVVAHFQAEYQSPWQFLLHGLTTLPFWLAIAGIVVSYVCYVAYPQLPAIFAQKFRWLYRLLQRKYWIDDTYDKVFGGGSRLIGNVLWHLGDVLIIDKGLVEGSAKITAKLGDWLRRLQTGYLYHYALAMIVGLLLLLAWFFIA
jgi:NADH-quinone oxidoreductase subunit L